MSLKIRNSRPRIRLLIVLVLVAATGVTVMQLNNSSDNPGKSEIKNIAGGQVVSAIAELPYQVSILSANPDLARSNPDNKNNWGWGLCGGSLIAQQWVLTADHCIRRNSNYGIEPLYIFIGADSTTYMTAFKAPLYVKAAYPARDAQYKKPDLMLLELTQPLNIDLGKTVALPVDVDTTTWPLQGSIATLSGWGKTGVGTDSSEVLKTVKSIIGDTPTSTEPCIGGGFYSPYVSSDEICVPGGTQIERIGACQGDSGGPLTVEVDGKPVLAGVASWAFNASCDGLLPVVYARVASHLTWIVPGAVKDINFQSGANGVLASWSPADRIPAVPIKDYVIQLREKGAENFSTINDGVSTTASATITNLDIQKQYEIRISALNDVNIAAPIQRIFSPIVTLTGAGVPVTTTLPAVTTVPAAVTTLPAVTTVPAATTVPAVPVVPPTEEKLSPQGIELPDLSKITVATPDKPSATNTIDAPVATTSPASPEKSVRAGQTLDIANVWKIAKINVPKNALVSLRVASSSKKYCANTSAGLFLKKSGKCKVTVVVTSAGAKAKSKAISILIPK